MVRRWAVPAICVLALLLIPCAIGAQDPAPPDDAPDLPSLEAQARKVWEHRDIQKHCQQTIGLLNKMVEADPSRLDLWTWLSLAYYWEGNNRPEKDREGRKTSYGLGVEAGEKAVALNPDSAGARFWRIVNKSSHAREIGVMKSMHLLPEVTEEIKRVDKLDPTYYYGGTKRLTTRIIYRTPWIVRKAKGYSLDDAIRLCHEALEIEPNFFFTHIYLADCYREKKDMDAVRGELRFILDTPTDVNPAFAAENRRDRATALKKWKELGFGEEEK